MNLTLQQMFSQWYTPDKLNNSTDGSSSVAGTEKIRKEILELIQRHNIRSMFDAGCNDCGWMSLIVKHVDYCGGDISESLIRLVTTQYPELKVSVHDITTDAIPLVDLLFCRDVAIHLGNQDRKKFWQNWYNSNTPWILTTHIQDCNENLDIGYHHDKFPWTPVNWEINPWNFPKPIETIDEYGPNGRCLALWHHSQFKGIL
jgi:hypothetical protein